MDLGSARQSYEAALAIDPGYLPAIRSLKTIHESSQDWAGYESTLIQEAQQTEDPEAKSRACLEVAKFYDQTKEDRETATRWWEEALRLQPDSLDAARPLADVYTAREEWPLGEQMLDIVVAQMSVRLVSDQDGALAKELCRQLYRRGYVAQKLGKQPKALESYERAYQLDATYLPALEALRQPARRGRPARRGAEDLPEHPHPPRRDAHEHREGRHLLPARRHPPRAEAGGPRPEPLPEGAGDRRRPRALAPGAGAARRPRGPLGQGGRVPAPARRGARGGAAAGGARRARQARPREAERLAHGDRRVLERAPRSTPRGSR